MIGSIQTISWTALALDPAADVVLWLYTDVGEWVYIDSVPPGQTSYSWLVPSPAMSGSRIVVGSLVGASHEATGWSNGTIAIVDAAGLVFMDGFESGNVARVVVNDPVSPPGRPDRPTTCASRPIRSNARDGRRDRLRKHAHG